MVIPVLLILFLGGLGIFFAYVSIALLRVTRRSRLKGEVTSGLVVTKRQEATRTSRGNINNYYAQIAYEVAGKTYTREIPVSHESYESWSDGRVVYIQYLPDQPEMGFLPTDNEPTDMIIGGLITAFILLAVSVFLVIAVVSSSRSH